MLFLKLLSLLELLEFVFFENSHLGISEPHSNILDLEHASFVVSESSRTLCLSRLVAPDYICWELAFFQLVLIHGEFNAEVGLFPGLRAGHRLVWVGDAFFAWALEVGTVLAFELRVGVNLVDVLTGQVGLVLRGTHGFLEVFEPVLHKCLDFNGFLSFSVLSFEEGLPDLIVQEPALHDHLFVVGEEVVVGTVLEIVVLLAKVAFYE